MTRVALVLAVAACAAAPPPVTSPGLPATTLRLANGVRVVLAPDPSVASVVVHVRAPAGTADGEAAALIVRALDTLDAPLEALGGWSTAQLSRDHASYALEVPAEALPRAVFLVAERFAHASVADALARRGDLAARTAGTRGELVARALAGPTPPATPDAIAALLRTRYAPGALVVVVTGGFAVADARRAVERYFGALADVACGSRCAGTATIDPAPPLTGAVLHDRQRDRVTVAFPVPEPFVDGRAELDVVARVLVARLGPALDVRVDPPFAIDAPAAGRVAVESALARLRDQPIAPAELARATGTLELEQVTALEGLAYRAAALAERAARGEPDLAGARRALTPARVQAVARVWLAPARAIVVVGDGP